MLHSDHNNTISQAMAEVRRRGGLVLTVEEPEHEDPEQADALLLAENENDDSDFEMAPAVAEAPQPKKSKKAKSAFAAAEPCTHTLPCAPAKDTLTVLPALFGRVQRRAGK
jgi:hypothetical protein